jgi:predicted pyridoxine 5'-phosphate oxidase superfamily flavin-nucleotide-binding protein
MDEPAAYSSDVAFTPSVKATRPARLAPRLRQCGAARIVEGSHHARSRPFHRRKISVFFGTASKDGQPYIQHRGGPPRFLKVLDQSTIGFADFTGNRQYISQGNLSDNPKAILFLIDYGARQRVKIWGAARVVEGDPELIARLMPEGYQARPEQAIIFTVVAWDANCQQHIPLRFEAAQVAAGARRARPGGSRLWRPSWHASARPGTRLRGCGFRVAP